MQKLIQIVELEFLLAFAVQLLGTCFIERNIFCYSIDFGNCAQLPEQLFHFLQQIYAGHTEHQQML